VGLVGLVWGVYLGALPRQCETDCASSGTYDVVAWTAAALAACTAGVATLKLFWAAISGDARGKHAGQRGYVVAGIAAFAAWFVGSGLLVH
jgi:hypothetical protein